ncbi:hypothetical protein A6U85_25780 [Agrobacterium sp. 13-626]|nr:hypothetical protein CN09_33075 [Rhizobium rhizogenes]OCJ04812.1 hypothetical protein A6U85_25780 [Agrobacterium sp. 13-626]OCJ29024.1 hypothetical protein A6U89_27470 [Agrobacterium sp. B133/95]
MTAELKKELRLGLDAIIRWLRAPPAAEEVRPSASRRFVFTLSPGLLGINDGATTHTFMAKRSDQPVQAVSGWPRLVAEMHAVRLCSYPLDDAAHADIRRIHLTPKADLSLPARFSDSNRIL